MAHLGHHDFVICGNYKKSKNLKISYILEKTLVVSIICRKCEKMAMKKYLKKKNQLKYQKLSV